MSKDSKYTQPRHHLLSKWSNELQGRWGVSANQVLIILFVFACTGMTVLFVKRPIVLFFSGQNDPSTLFSVLYYLLILPIYNVILLVYGFVFGQFRFFLNFEKKMLKKILGYFQSKK